MKQEKEPPVWLTALKLIVILAILIGGVGGALWWAGLGQEPADPSAPVSASSQSWGIAGDSPIRSKR